MGVRRVERSARRALDRLNEQLGAAGLLAAAAAPGLAAVVDQHAAAVRDILAVGESGTAVGGTVLLAGYAQGVQDHVRERGWQLAIPSDTAGWLRASWYHVRLLAVCALARNLHSSHHPVSDMA